MANRSKNTKEALLLRKEELLRELKYYDKRITDTRNSKTNSGFYDDNSSDSEEFPEFAVNSGPSLTELKLQETMVKTCLQATQELTNLQILQSEVNVMVNKPVFEGEPPVPEAGTWREVTAECRVDLVPFFISYNVHTTDLQFAPKSYRNLQVKALKSAHDKELSKSVLSSMRTPSEAFDVMLAYARAYRSRRRSLAELAEEFEEKLLMKPRAEGGYFLCCSGLRLVWVLQNKWSSLAHFSHQFNFELDYMDEPYINIVSSAHQQLSKPYVDTDSRTHLLTKIIYTYIQSGTDIVKNNTSADKEENQIGDKPENSTAKTKDSELMAPPRSVPKTMKVKLKRAREEEEEEEKTNDNKKFKRQRTEVNGDNDKSENVVKDTDSTVKSNLQEQANRDYKSFRDKNNLKSDSKHKKINKVNDTHKKVQNINNKEDTQKKKAVDNIFNTQEVSGKDLQSKVGDKEKNVVSKTDIQNNRQIKKISKPTDNVGKSNNAQENIAITRSIENMMHKSNENINKQTKDINDKEKPDKENNEIRNIQKAKQNNVIEESKHLSERFPAKDKLQSTLSSTQNSTTTNKILSTKIPKPVKKPTTKPKS